MRDHNCFRSFFDRFSERDQFETGQSFPVMFNSRQAQMGVDISVPMAREMLDHGNYTFFAQSPHHLESVPRDGQWIVAVRPVTYDSVGGIAENVQDRREIHIEAESLHLCSK